MGTRHLIIVYYKGQYHIAQYGQWDGGPARQGRDVLEFARDPELLAKLAAVIDAGLLYAPTNEELEEFDKKIEDMEKILLEKQRSMTHVDAYVLAVLRDPHGEGRAFEHARRLEGFKKMIAEIQRALEKVKIPGPNASFSSVEQRASHIICPSLPRDTGAKILRIVADATERVPIVQELDFIADGLFCEWAYVLDLDLRVLECWCGRGRAESKLQSARFDHLEAIQSGRGERPMPVASFPLDDLPDETTFVERCGETVKG